MQETNLPKPNATRYDLTTTFPIRHPASYMLDPPSIIISRLVTLKCDILKTSNRDNSSRLADQHILQRDP